MSMILTNQIAYFKSKPCGFKFILFIIVFRPLLNTLEETLPGLPISLLEIVGGFIFIVIVFSIFSTKLQWSSTTRTLYTLFYSLYLFNLSIILIANPNFSILTLLVKVVTPSTMFIYFIRTINNKQDLNLILTAFLVSLIPFAIVAIYDVAFVGTYDVTRRNMARLHTSYGDIVTAGIQINIIYSIILYKILEDDSWFGRKKYLFLSLFVFLSIFLLLQISHAASFGVFVVLTFIFVMYKFPRKKISILAIIVFSTILIYYIFGDSITKFYDGIYLLEYERIVNDGGTFDNEMILHGRGGRWLRLNEIFLDQNIIQIIFGGMGVRSPGIVGSFPHNDFLRILFSTGIIGLSIYLFFLISIVKIGLTRVVNYKYLVTLSMLTLLMYSFTATPSIYMDLNLFLMPVFAYIIKR